LAEELHAAAPCQPRLYDTQSGHESDRGVEGYPAYFIRVAFLAAELVGAILDGRQPIELSRDLSLASMPLPLDWRDRRAVLCFPARQHRRVAAPAE